jgi:hypothetical protein
MVELYASSSHTATVVDEKATISRMKPVIQLKLNDEALPHYDTKCH